MLGDRDIVSSRVTALPVVAELTRQRFPRESFTTTSPLMSGGEGSDDVRRGDRADQTLLPCSTPRMKCVGESVEWLQENDMIWKHPVPLSGIACHLAACLPHLLSFAGLSLAGWTCLSLSNSELSVLVFTTWLG